MKLKKWQRALIIVACVVFVWGVIAVFPRTTAHADNIYVVGKDNLPILIAHGGGNEEYPDNTLEAFCNAYSIDNNVMMETDVSITKDDVILLSHDTTIDRKTNKSGEIIQWNYSDLIEQQVDFAYNGVDEDNDDLVYTNYNGDHVLPTDVTYPQAYYDALADGDIEERSTTVFLATTLEDLLIVFPNNSINVEIKQSGDTGLKALQVAMDLVREYDALDRVVFASFHKEIYEQIKEYYKTNPNMMFSPEKNGVAGILVTSWIWVDLFYFEPIAVLQVPMSEGVINVATRNFVATAHRHNIAVHFWTIDDEEDMRYLISIGADGIMTNRPTLLKAVLDSYI
ncbi:MAG: glycerophosphodiester phosphodiesterase family protein [Clostridia bacterium]|nr:glycerophosphodiester phosphodiesterase family protein [Clostridia bacterium]